MVIETSILTAIELREPGYEVYLAKIDASATRCVSACSLFEAGMVLSSKRGPLALLELDDLIQRLDIAIVSFDEDQARLAQSAFLRYGKGRDAAQLNLGDCLSYALAKHLNAPLLFKGNDFSRTDLLIA